MELRSAVQIEETGKNLFHFQFANAKDKDRVPQGVPWWFDKKVLGLAKFDGATRPSDLRPYTTPLWVRIYDLPFNQRMMAATISFDNKIGVFLDWDNTDEGRWECFIHIRVMVNLKHPLKRGSLIKTASGDTTKVFF